MGYTTKVLALWRMGFQRGASCPCSGFPAGIGCRFRRRRMRREFPAITDLNDSSRFPIWRFIAMSTTLVCSAWRRRCFGLFRLIGNFRAEGKARCLARRMLDVVGLSFVAADHVRL